MTLCHTCSAYYQMVSYYGIATEMYKKSNNKDLEANNNQSNDETL